MQLSLLQRRDVTTA